MVRIWPENQGMVIFEKLFHKLINLCQALLNMHGVVNVRIEPDFCSSGPKKARILGESGPKMVRIFLFSWTRISEMVIGSPGIESRLWLLGPIQRLWQMYN